MPTVRELVNRISFKVNPGDKANAGKAFSNMKGQAGGVIAFAKGIGGAISAALKGIGLLTAAGSKFYTDMEKDQATMKFFSKTKQEADNLLATIDKLRSGNQIISTREMNQAGAVFGKLNLKDTAADFERIFPMLRDITKANPEMDFAKVTEAVKSFIQSGDIESLRSLGAVGKEIAEAIELSGMDVNQAIKGQANKYQFLLDKLLEKKDRLSELAKDQEGTQTFAWQGMAKEGSDFLVNFGEKTSPAITEAVSAIRDMLKELNESEGFWTGVTTAIDGMRWMLEKIADAVRYLRGFGGEGKASLQSGAAQDYINSLSGKQKKGKPVGQYGFGNMYVPQLSAEMGEGIVDFGKKKADEFRASQSWMQPQKIEVKVEVEGKGELAGLDRAGLEKAIKDVILPPLVSIATQNGGNGL